MSAHLFHPKIDWEVQGVFTERSEALPKRLTSRVISAYQAAMSEFQGHGTSMWQGIDGLKREVDAVLSAGDDAVARLLSDPGATVLFWGVDPTLPELSDEFRRNPRAPTLLICDRVLRLAEAVGALTLRSYFAGQRTEAVDIAETIAAIERCIGVQLEFPNPYPREFVIETPRGGVAERALQAIFQAWRIRQLAKEYGGKALEIGPGLGRTAYYARAFGIRSYTTVGLPMDLVCQAAFLGRVLAEHDFALPHEIARPGQIRMLTPAKLLSSDEQFDIVINADSMTEMDRDHAEAYTAFIAAHSKVFISINHDGNSFRVCDLAGLQSATTIRAPHWLNPGYPEEFFFF